MRKTISVIATVLFIIGTCGIIGGLAAKERVPIVIKKTVIEGAVNNNVIKFLEDKLGSVNVDEDKIKALGLPYENIRDAVRIAVKNTEEARDLIVKHPDLFTDFEITKGKMDDVFLAVTGKKLEGGAQ